MHVESGALVWLLEPKALTGPGSLWRAGAIVGTNVVDSLRISMVGKETLRRVGDILDSFVASVKHCNIARAFAKNSVLWIWTHMKVLVHMLLNKRI